MAVTKQGTALAAHIENKEWQKARALVTSIINVQTLVKSGWLLVWNLPDVPGSLILLLLKKIKVLSHYQRKPFPIGLYPFMFQDKFSDFVQQTPPSSLQAFLIALSDTYRDVEWPKPNQLEEYIDTLWQDYFGLPHRYSGGNRVTGNQEHVQAALRVHSLQDLEKEPELHSLWLKTEILLKAASGYNLEQDDNDEQQEWLVLHAIAELDCLTIIMWFALRLYPHQATMRRKLDGNTPLHIAVTKPIFASHEDSFHHGPAHIIHHERTMYPLELQEAQDFMASFLAKAVPQSATYMNDNYHTPLIHCIQSYASHCHICPPHGNNRCVHSQVQYQTRLKSLIGAAPQALASRDLSTRLYPFQMAAVANAPLDFIYTLFRGDPAALKYRRLTKREADYERVLEENANLKMELETKTKYIQELQSQLKEFERKQLMQSNTTTTKTTSAPARKRTKHC